MKYYLFSRRYKNKSWEYFNEFDTKEECESEMEFHGEPEAIEYLVIKGTKLEYEEGVAIYPFVIKE